MEFGYGLIYVQEILVYLLFSRVEEYFVEFNNIYLSYNQNLSVRTKEVLFLFRRPK